VIPCPAYVIIHRKENGQTFISILSMQSKSILAMEVVSIKKALFIVCTVLASLSLLAIYICVILEKSFPILGRMAVQFSADRYYAPQDYALELKSLIIGCCVVFLCNSILACWAFISEIRENKGEEK